MFGIVDEKRYITQKDIDEYDGTLPSPPWLSEEEVNSQGDNLELTN